MTFEMRTELLEHQRAAVDKLRRLKVGALYMEMGTGKTRTALELLAMRLRDDKVDSALWLCPFSVQETIRREMAKHVRGDMPVDIFGIESLSNSTRLYFQLLRRVQNGRVFLVVDESNLVKNHKAIRSERITRIAGHCKYKLILNGTPVSRTEADLFAQWRLLDWRILGYQSFWAFQANHIEWDERQKGKIKRVLDIDYLSEKIAPYTYQVKKSECITLPRKWKEEKFFDLTYSQSEHYADVKNEFLRDLDETDRTTIYRLFTAVQHVVCGRRVISGVHERIQTVPFFERPEDDPRLERLLDFVGLLSGKTIIWCKNVHEIKKITEFLNKLFGYGSAIQFFGEVPPKQREVNIERFRTSARFLIANKTCGGYGLNLQFANNMVFYSNDWDWATRAQAEDRAHRIGQEGSLLIVDVVAQSTIDERILKCLKRKTNMVEDFKREIKARQNNFDFGRWIDGAEDLPTEKCFRCSGGAH